MAWYDRLRTASIRHEYYDTDYDAKIAQSKHPNEKTRISRFTDFKDSKGNRHYRYVLHFYKVAK